MRADLFLFSLKSHRWGILGWAAALLVFMWVVGAAYVQEVGSTTGGAAALGGAIEATARAMRVTRWPAERLDTLGGYLTYHNLILIPLLLGIYAVVQGTRAIRGAEEDGVLPSWLVAGGSRRGVIRDRALAFLAGLVPIAAGLALGTALAMRTGGEPRDADALLTAATAALAAACFYALALLVSQLVRGSGRAAGLSVLAMVSLFVVSNTWEDLGPLAVLRYVSPFHLRQRSDVLIPGHTFDLGATLALAAIVAALIGLAAIAFERRDLGAGLWERRPRERAGAPIAIRPRGPVAAALADQRLALAAWTAGTAVFMGMYASLGPAAVEIWERVEFMRALLVRGEGGFAAQYVAFALGVLAPVVGGFATAQAGRWASDAASGRLEMVLACPIPRKRIALERLAVVAAGALAPIAGGLGGFAVGAAVSGLAFDPVGAVRTALDLELFALAVAGAGALLVLLIRGAVTGVLAGLLAGSYLLTMIALLFDWPDWVVHASVFEAFGEPYLATPETSGLLLLGAIALGGTIAAAEIAERRSRAV